MAYATRVPLSDLSGPLLGASACGATGVTTRPADNRVRVYRVTERRRAAVLARHYRDSEGLSIHEIARRLERAPATVKAYLYDPTGDRAREVKARYRGVCRGCGASTTARNGKRWIRVRAERHVARAHRHAAALHRQSSDANVERAQVGGLERERQVDLDQAATDLALAHGAADLRLERRRCPSGAARPCGCSRCRRPGLGCE